MGDVELLLNITGCFPLTPQIRGCRRTGETRGLASRSSTRLRTGERTVDLARTCEDLRYRDGLVRDDREVLSGGELEELSLTQVYETLDGGIE